MLHVLWCEDADKFSRSAYDTTMEDNHSIVGMPIGSRLHRIMRVDRHTWLLWISTNDYRLGTYLLLHDDGLVERVTVRQDEGDETQLVRPTDRSIQAHEDSK